jgi:Cof subfamily protein (haloacid dehalogenase superfamily)
MEAPLRDVKLFATDLDGTVLTDHGPGGSGSSPAVRAALRGLQDRGVTVCLASGRMHESMRFIADSMGLSGPIISYNGAMLRGGDDQVLEQWTLDSALAQEIVALAEERGLPLNYYHGGVLYARRVQPWWDLYEERTSSPMRAVDSLRSLAGTEPFKLLIITEPARIRALKEELAPRFGDRCEVLITADEYLEFMPKGADKGRALAVLAGRLGLGPSQVAAAGDGWNDLGMLRWAGLGIAMASGRPELKAVADVVVPGPEEDGLARFIQDRFLAASGATRG